ncbi:hypothetical protein WJX75_002339 [Coccomyxa subellipsoidea]|uniref:Arylamine N-acetyltransferase n=1 Tax=Coccomyxa subellipsoidea TaxID=248742 RepID=A0ABR2Z3I4_9CHLO
MGFHPSPPSLDIDIIFNKLVIQKRGGYCFEQNGLLAAVLQHLGYELYTTFSNVVRENSEAAALGQVELKGFSHNVILVRGPEDGHWRLVDAGFGGRTPTHPVLLEHPADDSYTGDTVFRVRRGLIGKVAEPTTDYLEHESHALGWYLQRYSHTAKQWQDQHFFREVEAAHGDFEVINWAIATSPTKGFYHTLTMGIQRPDGGRVTLQDDVLRIIQSSDKAEERILQTPEDFKAALEEYFGIRPITS